MILKLFVIIKTIYVPGKTFELGIKTDYQYSQNWIKQLFVLFWDNKLLVIKFL